jgi:peptidoglycan-associated lipoprotein
MKPGITKGISAVIGLFCAACVLGCHHEVAKAQPAAAPPPAPAPTATLAANPAYVQQGQSTMLTWQTSNATDINIQGVGTVSASGSRTITPPQSTSYELVAKGPGGTADVSARVTVNTPYASRSDQSGSDLFADNVVDVYFDYDRFNIRTDQLSHIQSSAHYLERHSSTRVVIEGHCDDRGSLEYNIALGAKRASAVQKALVGSGVSSGQLQTISYGKERPFCSQDSEQCWQANRRGHFAERQ